MNEFTVGFEVDFGGMSERFVSEEAYKTQQKLKDDYMRRDQKHMETISELETKIANQSKEITRLLKNQEKLKAEAVNDEKTISALQSNNAMLLKKIGELYEGIRNSEALTWKEKYDNLKKATDGTIQALQKKCVNIQYGVASEKRDGYISELENRINNLEHNYNEEVRMKEHFKRTCFNHERTIESQNSTIRHLKGQVSDYVHLNSVLKCKLVSIGELANKIDDVILSEE